HVTLADVDQLGDGSGRDAHFSLDDDEDRPLPPPPPPPRRPPPPAPEPLPSEPSRRGRPRPKSPPPAPPWSFSQFFRASSNFAFSSSVSSPFLIFSKKSGPKAPMAGPPSIRGFLTSGSPGLPPASGPAPSFPTGAFGGIGFPPMPSSSPVSRSR